MIKHNAIRKAYPNVITIDEKTGCFDADGDLVEIDESLVEIAAEQIKAEEIKELEEKAIKREAILARLGITAEEARLLLS